MGRRRAGRRTAMQKLKRVKNVRAKDENEFRNKFMSGQEMDDMFRIYHSEYVEPLEEIVNHLLLPWYKRLWLWLGDMGRIIRRRWKNGDADDHTDDAARGAGHAADEDGAG